MPMSQGRRRRKAGFVLEGCIAGLYGSPNQHPRHPVYRPESQMSMTLQTPAVDRAPCTGTHKRKGSMYRNPQEPEASLSRTVSRLNTEHR